MIENLKNEIIKNGGLTCDDKLKKVNLKNGFMVSIIGYEFTTKNIDEAIKKGVEYQNIIKDKKGYYIGFWIDNNIIYVDISKKIDNLRDATKTAKKNIQKAIYNNKTQKSIYLDYNITYYTLYKIIKTLDDKIKDYKFIKQVDNLRDIPSNYRTDKKNYIIFKDLININEL